MRAKSGQRACQPTQISCLETPPNMCLPAEAPDHPVTTIALECDSEPTQDNIFVRKEKPREGV